MHEEHRSIVFSSAIDNIKPVNSSFDQGVMKIAYWGFSRNKTFISKESFERAIPSMLNCPLVCNYNRETDSIGSHDMEIVKSAGRTRFVNITTPVGVVPESATAFWQEVYDEKEDVVREYLCTPVLLWKRQEAYAHIKENGITDESMEIRVISGKRGDDGIFYIDDFEFTAFCLLESAAPCFEDASVELFSLKDFKSKYADMMEEIKREFSTVSPTSVDDIVAPTSAENFSKGGNGLLDISMLMLKYGITEQDIDFELDGLSEQEIENRFAEIKAAADAAFNAEEDPEADPDVEETSADEPDSEPEEPSSEPEEDDAADDDDGETRKQFSLTGEQFLIELTEALWQAKYTDPEWGEMCRYGYVDYDPAVNEVYAYDYMDWKLYGMTYSMSGDRVVIDFECKKRKKFAFVDYDMGEELFCYKELFTQINNKFASMSSELNALRTYKLSIEAAERTEKIETVFESFADLEGDERFEKLKSNCDNMEIDEIEDRCFAIRGRNIQMKFSQDNTAKAQRLPVEKNLPNAGEPYGGVFIKYGVGNR